jgi:imidazole glycerol phosphate synthase glutamine amidotransferase subunit
MTDPRGMAESEPRIGVVDYGAGNLVSIEQGLTAAGASARVVGSPGGLADLDGLVVPGVGAAAPAMVRLGRAGLIEPIRAWIESERPFLGICLGLQLLFEGSDEDGAETLGVLPGRTVRLTDAPTLPHIGWNQVERRTEHPLFDGVADGSDFYFVHSYAGVPPDDATEVVLAETTHGGTFVSAVARGPLLGVQFHPERSGDDGLTVLRNFARIVYEAA